MSTGCDAPKHTSGLMPVEQALALLLERATTVKETETVDLRNSAGRVLAQPVISAVNVPPADNSAMDGYAVALSETHEYAVVGTALAGHPFTGSLKPGECVRIMTGAPVPAGTDLVEMQENAERDGDQVCFTQPLKPSSNIRRAGEDIAQGSEVLPAGRRLTPSDCGLLASIGQAEVIVYRPLRVALLTTGDELVAPGTELQPGQIYESNSFVLKPMLEKLGADVSLVTSLEDTPWATQDALEQAAAASDIIITCGGVSVGDADYVKPAVEELGELALWKLAIKPGKPLAFGRVKSALFLGLPGNPVSSLVTLHQLGLPLLRTMSGETLCEQVRLNATTTTPLKKSPGRAFYLTGVAVVNKEGQLDVASTGAQGSGILSSVSRANCFIVLEQDRGRVEAGETVIVELFDQWLQ